MTTLPAFYDDLDLTQGEAWRLLDQGASKRDVPMHTPVVTTIGRDGCPQARVMVLRELDKAGRLLRFHTDARAPKIADIGGEAPFQMLGYDPEAKVQLRISGEAWIEQDSEAADAAWNASTLFARRCYLATGAPGEPADGPTSGLPDEVEGIKPSEAQITPARANFAILICEITKMEWLYLANAGHRRARFRWRDDRWHGQWLIP